MANKAAIIPAAKAPLEIRPVDFYHPDRRELLVKNEVIAFNPIEYKIAKLGFMPIQYPSILGVSYGGTVQAVGADVTGFKVGDKVAVAKAMGVADNKYGAYQQYVITPEDAASKISPDIDVTIPASLVGNLKTVVGLFSGVAGLDKPSLDTAPPSQKKKVLIYGGSSSLGSLSVQYVAQAGYQVITTSSPQHDDFVSKLGATQVINHRQDESNLIDEISAAGPYDLVVDCISLPKTIAVNAQVLSKQGGGKLYTVVPPLGPENLPSGVNREFSSWGAVFSDEKHAQLLRWAIDVYLPEGVALGKIIPLPIEKIPGGLSGVETALDRLQKGVSGMKLVVDPQE